MRVCLQCTTSQVLPIPPAPPTARHHSRLGSIRGRGVADEPSLRGGQLPSHRSRHGDMVMVERDGADRASLHHRPGDLRPCDRDGDADAHPSPSDISDVSVPVVTGHDRYPPASLRTAGITLRGDQRTAPRLAVTAPTRRTGPPLSAASIHLAHELTGTPPRSVEQDTW